MTQFLLIISLLHPNGTMTITAQRFTGADLCLSEQAKPEEQLETIGAADGTYSVQCVDTKIALHFQPT